MPAGPRSSSRISFPALAAVAATLILIGVGAYVALGFLGGNTDRDGRVAVPGSKTLTLEGGEIDVFYAEDVSLGENQELAPPTDLAIRVTGPGGEPLEIRRRGGQEVSGGSGTATLIGSFDAPRDGAYEIATRSAGAASRNRPEVTLGESPFDAVGDRLGEVGDAVLGPVGLVALALLVLLALVGWIRDRATLEGPTLPRDGER